MDAEKMRELVEALRPFADLADFLDEQPDPRWQNPDDEVQVRGFPYTIGVGQLHAAREAYCQIATAHHTENPAAVEAVARAIYDTSHAGLSNCYAWDDSWEAYQEARREVYYKQARAAIAALRALSQEQPNAE